MEFPVAKSYPEIYEIVSTIKQKFFTDTEMWFRGQPQKNGKEKYFLKPSLLRVPKRIDYEKELFFEYKKLISGIENSNKDDWETLINMQHYGIPTRLLDWTENLGVALYFAASSCIYNTPMNLYIMNPIALNNLSGKKGIPIFPSNTMGLSYIKNYIDKEPFPARYPIAVKCEYVNKRVAAQSGMFTIHGDEKKDIDIIETLLDQKDQESAIYKVNIAPEAYNSLKEYFDICGLNAYTIFPDIQGIAQHLRNKLTYHAN